MPKELTYKNVVANESFELMETVYIFLSHSGCYDFSIIFIKVYCESLSQRFSNDGKTFQPKMVASYNLI